MAGKFVPSSFNKATVMAGLYKAMEFGAPTRVEDRVTFYIKTDGATISPADGEGVPFDPASTESTTYTPIQVDVAISFTKESDSAASYGQLFPNRISLLLLDPDYQKVKGFAYVVAGGVRYVEDYIEPPVALGSIDVWTVWATASSK